MNLPLYVLSKNTLFSMLSFVTYGKVNTPADSQVFSSVSSLLKNISKVSASKEAYSVLNAYVSFFTLWATPKTS